MDTRVQVDGKWRLEVVCPEHGSFFQDPAKHKFGQGCPYCANNKPLVSPMEFVRTTWPHVEWVDTFSDAHSKMRVNGVCPHHGKFDKLVSQLRGIAEKGGEACPRCAKLKVWDGKRIGKEEWTKRVYEVFPGYTFKIDDRTTGHEYIDVTCPTHGVWEAKLQDLARGHGCMKCWLETRESRVVKA